VIVGLDQADDAGVYKVTDDLAIIQTVDFFTPIVDDPYWFGQIAAANALSDVYAMGGVPKTAMNLVAFPIKDMDISVLRQILQGGLDKMKEAGVVLLKTGDRLILTKPLGTGIINTAIKGGLASKEITDTVTRLMATLNRDAAEIMKGYPVHACTDITGFGLLGHIAEMIIDTGFSIKLTSKTIPIIPETLEYAGMGLVPAGTYNNREFRECMVDFAPSVDSLVQDVLFDPQTSGGLLICVDRKNADELLEKLKEKGMANAAIIGEVATEPKEKIIVK
jgi:selenide,water dikinase